MRGRLLMIIVSLSVATALIGIRTTSHLWPTLPLAIAIGAVALGLAAYGFGPSSVWIGGAIFLLGAHTSIALLLPATLSGIDPDTYAMWVTQAVRSGSMTGVGPAIYQDLPVYILFVASVSHVIGLPPSVALIAVSLALAVIVPIMAAWAASRLLACPLTAWPATVAALGTSILTMTVSNGFLPIPMTLGYVLLLLAIWTSTRYLHQNKLSEFAVLAVLISAITFTHKFLLLPLVAVFFAQAMVSWLPMTPSYRHKQFLLPMIGIAMLGIQWSFQTFFGVAAVVNLAYIVGFSPIDTLPTVATTTSHPVVPRLLGVLARRGHAIVLLPLAAISWLIIAAVAYRTRSTDRLLVAAAIAALAAFLPLSIAVPSVLRYTRIIAMVEPLLLAVAVAVGVLAVRRAGRPALPIVVLLAVLLIAGQVGSAPISADHPVDYRAYLTNDEVAAKSWGIDHGANNVSADPFFAHERPSPEAYVDQQGRIRPHYQGSYREILEPYTNRSLLKACPSGVLYRSIRIYRSRGAQVLEWNPLTTLNSTYGRIYDNGDAQHFRQPMCGYD